MGTTVYIPIYDRIKNIVISKDLINLVYPNIKEVLGADYSYAIDKEVHYANDKILFEQYNIVFSDIAERLFEINLNTFALECRKLAESEGYFLIYSDGNIYLSDEPLSFISINGLEGYYLDFCRKESYDSEVEGIISVCNKFFKGVTRL